MSKKTNNTQKQETNQECDIEDFTEMPVKKTTNAQQQETDKESGIGDSTEIEKKTHNTQKQETNQECDIIDSTEIVKKTSNAQQQETDKESGIGDSTEMKEKTNNTQKQETDKESGIGDSTEMDKETNSTKNCGAEQEPDRECDVENSKQTAKKKKWKMKMPKKETVEVPDDNVPYDRGWAWMIVVSGFINLAIASGYNRAMSIFFVNFLEEFCAPVSQTAMLFGVKAGVDSVAGLFIMNAVLGRFGVRKTVFVGGICLALSSVLGSLATDVTTLVLCQSIFHGLGMSMVNMPITVLLGFYFRRRRSMANSIMKCGVGVGAVALPPIVTYLLAEYGLRGSLLIMGGFCLNAVVGAMFLRPVSFYQKLKEDDEEKCPDKLRSSELEDSEDKEEAAVVLLPSGRNCQCESERTDQNSAPPSCVSGHGAQNGTLPVLVFSNATQSDKTKSAVDNSVELDRLLNNQNDVQSKCSSQKCSRRICSRENQCVKQQGFPVSLHDSLLSATVEKERNGTVFVTDGKMNPLNFEFVVEVECLSKSTPALNHLDVSGCGQHDVRPRTYSCAYKTDGRPSGDEEKRRAQLSLLDAVSRSSLVRYLSKPDLNIDTPALLASALSLQQKQQQEQQSDLDSEEHARQKRGSCGVVVRALKRVFGVLDFSLFRSPLFRLLCVFFVVSPLLYSVPVYLPAMCKERGLDEDQRAVLLSIIGGLDFICRLGSGFLADLRIIKISTIIAAAYLIVGVFCHLIPVFTTFGWMVFFCVINGLFGGVGACLLSMLIMEDIGLEQTAKAFGFIKLISGAAMAAFYPLLGYVRDATGSYEIAYHVIGACTIVSAIIIFCTRFIRHSMPGADNHDKDTDESSPLAEGTPLCIPTDTEKSKS